MDEAKCGKLLSFFKEVFKEITNFGDLKIFENAITNTNITIFDKTNSSNEKVIYTEFKKSFGNENILNYSKNNNLEINKNNLEKENFTFLDKENETIKNKIENKSIQLGKLNYKIRRGLKTSFNDGFVIKKREKDEIINKSKLAKEFIKPLLRGRDIAKYSYKFNDQWVISIPLDGQIEIKIKRAEKYIKSFPVFWCLKKCENKSKLKNQ